MSRFKTQLALNILRDYLVKLDDDQLPEEFRGLILNDTEDLEWTLLLRPDLTSKISNPQGELKGALLHLSTRKISPAEQEKLNEFKLRSHKELLTEFNLLIEGVTYAKH